MNTKILVMLVIGIAVIGLTGVASARETSTSSIYYEFLKEVEGEGIHVINDLDAITSTAGWSYNNPHGGGGSECPDEAVFIENTVVDTYATFDQDRKGEYDATVIQTGSASMTKRPLNSEAPCDLPEFEARVDKSQAVIVSGQFKEFGTSFTDRASVGVNYYKPIMDTVSHCGNCHAEEISEASGNVLANGASKISEAAIGTSSWTSLKAMGWEHAPTVGTTADWVYMDGGSSAYSEFFGDSLVTPDAGNSITTSADTVADHSWTYGCGNWP
jgi:hypothetical protein